MSPVHPVDARRRYLLELPQLRVRGEPGAEEDASGLPVLARRRVGDRTIQFALVPAQARLRLTFVDLEPVILGHVTGLDTDTPTCYVSESAHLEWARTADHTRQILDIAVFTWRHRRRLLAHCAATERGVLDR